MLYEKLLKTAEDFKRSREHCLVMDLNMSVSTVVVSLAKILTAASGWQQSPGNMRSIEARSGAGITIYVGESDPPECQNCCPVLRHCLRSGEE